MTSDHTENVIKQWQQVHAYIDRLPGDQLSAVYGLLETMLSPLDRKLALAPLDDEPVTPEDISAIQAGLPRSKQDAACRWKRCWPISDSRWTTSGRWLKHRGRKTAPRNG